MGTQLPSPKRERSSPTPRPNFRPMSVVAKSLHATWYGGRPRSKLALPKKGAEPPQLSAHVYCGQTAGWIKIALGMEVGLGPGHIVLDRDPATLPQKGHLGQDTLCLIGIQLHSPKKGHSLQFSTHVYCGQTVVCIRMIPFGTEVGLSLGDIVLDGDPAPPPRRGNSPPILGQCHIWTNVWVD